MELQPRDMTTLRDGRRAILLGNHVPVRGVGDSVILTALVREVHKRWPELPIAIVTRGPKEVFLNNPYITEVYDGTIGHSLDLGSGHYITRKCRYFGISDPELHGELYFTDKERNIARETLKLLSPDKPTIMFCQNSTDNRRNWTRDNWTAVIDALSPWYDVYQIEQKIHYHRFEPTDPSDGLPCVYDTVLNARQELRNLDLRHAMALQCVSGKYLGSNTGFIHIAQCFGTDNAMFAHTKFAGDTEWLYPEAYNFFEDAKVEDVIQKLIEMWGL